MKTVKQDCYGCSWTCHDLDPHVNPIDHHTDILDTFRMVAVSYYD